MISGLNRFGRFAPQWLGACLLTSTQPYGRVHPPKHGYGLAVNKGWWRPWAVTGYARWMRYFLVSALFLGLLSGCDGRTRQAEHLLADKKPLDALTLAKQILADDPGNQDAKVIEVRAMAGLGGAYADAGLQLLPDLVAGGWDPGSDEEVQRLAFQSPVLAFDPVSPGEPVEFASAPTPDGTLFMWTKSGNLVRMDTKGGKSVLFRLSEHPEMRGFNDPLVRLVPDGDGQILFLAWIEVRGQTEWKVATFRVSPDKAEPIGRFSQEDLITPFCTDDGKRLLGLAHGGAHDSSDAPAQLVAIDPATGAQTIVAQLQTVSVASEGYLRDANLVVLSVIVAPEPGSKRPKGRLLQTIDPKTGVVQTVFDLDTLPVGIGGDEYWFSVSVDSGPGPRPGTLLLGAGGSSLLLDRTTWTIDSPLYQGFVRGGPGSWVSATFPSSAAYRDLAWRTTWPRWLAWQEAVDAKSATLEQWRAIFGVG